MVREAVGLLDDNGVLMEDGETAEEFIVNASLNCKAVPHHRKDTREPGKGN